MRLIDADALMDKLIDELEDGDVLYRIPPYAIDDAPTVDAVPVVRCRDCVSYGVDEYGDFRCNHPEGMDFPGDNDFCSYGQRKDQSANPGKMEGQPDGEP